MVCAPVTAPFIVFADTTLRELARHQPQSLDEAYAIQDRMIADADELTPHNRFDVHTLPSSHSPFASMPDRLAAVLDALA